jgi:hypothetical protein
VTGYIKKWNADIGEDALLPLAAEDRAWVRETIIQGESWR